MKNILFTLSATPAHENLFFISKILFSHSLIPTPHGITNKYFFIIIIIILWLSPAATTRPEFPSFFFTQIYSSKFQSFSISNNKLPHVHNLIYLFFSKHLENS